MGKGHRGPVRAKAGLALVLAIAVAGLVPAATLAASTNQSVSITVSAIDQLAVSGSPGAMTINSAVAGSPPTSVSDSSTTYSLTTNSTIARVVDALLSAAMPSGVTLKMAATAPPGTSAGTVTLTNASATNVLTSITQAVGTGTITYTLSATSAAAIGSGSVTVTLTLH